jgi:hypothetical protein
VRRSSSSKGRIGYPPASLHSTGGTYIVQRSAALRVGPYYSMYNIDFQLCRYLACICTYHVLTLHMLKERGNIHYSCQLWLTLRLGRLAPLSLKVSLSEGRFLGRARLMTSLDLNKCLSMYAYSVPRGSQEITNDVQLL